MFDGKPGASAGDAAKVCSAETKHAKKRVESSKKEAPARDKDHANERLKSAERVLDRLHKDLEKKNMADACTEAVAILEGLVDEHKKAVAAAPSKEELAQKKDDFAAKEEADRISQREVQYGKVRMTFASAPNGEAKTHFACGEPIWAHISVTAGSDPQPIGNPVWLSVDIDGRPNEQANTAANVPTKIAAATAGEVTWNLTPDRATIIKERFTDSYPKKFVAQLATLSLGKHTIKLTNTGTHYASASSEFEVECGDYSKSEYAKRAAEFESSKIAANRLPEKDANPAISTEVKKLADEYCHQEGCVTMVAKTTIGELTTFGTQVNGEWTEIKGRGYYVGVAIKKKDSTCEVLWGKYQRAYVADEHRYDEHLTFKPDVHDPIECANVK